MRSVLSCYRSRDTHAATQLIAVTALSLFLVAGIMPTSSHAQPLLQTNIQERNAPALDARDLPAQALFNQAVSMEQESPEKAVSKYDEVMQRYGRAATPGSRQFAARALLNKASILIERDDPKEAIATYERIERNFGNEKTSAIREVLASAIVSKAEAFYKLSSIENMQGNIEKTLATYDQLDQQFSKEDESDFIRRLTDIAKWRATEIRINNKTALSSKP